MLLSEKVAVGLSWLIGAYLAVTFIFALILLFQANLGFQTTLISDPQKFIINSFLWPQYLWQAFVK